MDIRPKHWEDRLTLFVGHLIQEKRKSTTIRSYVSAIRAILLEDNYELNDNKSLISSLTRACRLHFDRVQLRLPIHQKLLNTLLHKVEILYDQQPYLSVLYRAIMSTAYFGMFRIGELTSGNHPVLAQDVHVGDNKNKMLFVL